MYYFKTAQSSLYFVEASGYKTLLSVMVMEIFLK